MKSNFFFAILLAFLYHNAAAGLSIETQISFINRFGICSDEIKTSAGCLNGGQADRCIWHEKTSFATKYNSSNIGQNIAITYHKTPSGQCVADSEQLLAPNNFSISTPVNYISDLGICSREILESAGCKHLDGTPEACIWHNNLPSQSRLNSPNLHSMVTIFYQKDSSGKCIAEREFLARPSDAKAIAKAVKVYNYLLQLPNQTTHRIVSGQMIGDASDGVAGAQLYLDRLFSETGYYAGMVGADYLDTKNRQPVDYTALNRTLKKYSQSGSLITIGWHASNPFTGGAFNDRSVGDLSALLDPVSPVRAAWLKEMDHVAVGLQDLQEAGVVVLWRPLLEMNGTWFWWGAAQPTQAQFQAIWHDMYDYLVNKKGLHNLLWVYSPNNNPATASPGFQTPIFYYPGSDVVDIVGSDDYHDVTVIHQYDELVQLGKPMALCEVGPHTVATPPVSTIFSQLIPALAANYPKITFFQAWYTGYAIDFNLDAFSLMSDPRTANQNDVRSVVPSN